MKKKLRLRDQRLISIQKKRGHRKVVSKAKAKCKRMKVAWNGKRQIERFPAPFAFNIMGEKNRGTLLRFISRLREAVLTRESKVVVDFADTEVLNPLAALLFVAELDRMKRIMPSSFAVSIENVKIPRVAQVLHQIGIYKICGGTGLRISEDNFEESVKHWRYATGTRAGDETNEAFENFEGRLSTELAKGMWKGVSEAVVNSVQHAYTSRRFDHGPRLGHPRWWMFSQERDGFLTVVVCDLGIGIPRSLPINWEPKILERLFAIVTSEGDDLRAVRASLEVGKTSTNAVHRGKGLPQIWNTLRNTPDANIIILSNRAHLAWSQTEGKEFAHEYKTSIAGTIIAWTVKTINNDPENN